MGAADPVRHIPPGERVPGHATPGMVREEAVSTGGMWAGFVRTAAHDTSGWHHHGDYETAIYVISGHARFLTGAEGKEVHDAGPGDFVWVPPHEHHVEMNLSEAEPVRMVVSRSTQETLVFNVD